MIVMTTMKRLTKSPTTSLNDSYAERFAKFDDAAKEMFFQKLSPEEAKLLEYEWRFWARQNQLPPKGDDWYIWLLLAGRGFGKTRTGAEYIRWGVESGVYGRIALVAPTSADARDVMVEGPSGLLSVSPPWNRAQYLPSKRRVVWKNGATAYLYSAEEPDRLRGPQHDLAWVEELAAWKPSPDEAWSNLMFGLRLPPQPKVVVTTTPRPIKLIKRMLLDAQEGKVVVTTGSTYENRSNLAESFFNEIVSAYEGTRLGLQEIYAKILDDVPGALWNRDMIASLRVKSLPEGFQFKRVVVAIDPAVTAGAESNETGIIVAGLGQDDHGYILADLSVRDTPDSWARRAIEAFRYFNADRMVAEANNGGDLVEAVLRTVDPNIPYKKVHASRGKRIRAEPIAALYEQGRVHHFGEFIKLEDQMCSFVPESDESPDHLDAMVWALTELMLGGRATIPLISPISIGRSSSWGKVDRYSRL